MIITTANVHFLIRETPWASLTPHSGNFSKVRTAWLDLGQTGHFDNESELTKSFCWKIISFLPYRHPAITHTPIIWIAAKSQAKMNYRCFAWNKLSLLQTLCNKETNLRSLQCPLEGELTVWLISRNSLIKSEILIAMGMVWPVSSDKWKAPLVISQAGHRQSDVKPSLCNEVR